MMLATKKLDPQIIKAVARAISNETERKILASTIAKAKSIEEISSETRIPLETCREKVLELANLGLLVSENDSDLYGHRIEKYRRASLHIVVDREQLLVLDID